MAPGPSFEYYERLRGNICILEREASGQVKAMAGTQEKCMASEQDACMLQFANHALHNSTEVAANAFVVIAEQGDTIVRLTAELEVAVAQTGASEIRERGM